MEYVRLHVIILTLYCAPVLTVNNFTLEQQNAPKNLWISFLTILLPVTHYVNQNTHLHSNSNILKTV